MKQCAGMRGGRKVCRRPAISREVTKMIGAMSRRARLQVIAAGGLAAVLLLAACGGGDSASESTAASPQAEVTATEAPPETKELTKVTYVMPWVIQGEEAGQFAALRNGYFEEAGLDVEIIAGGPDIRAGALLASGSADFATMNPTGIYTNRAEGIPVVGVGVMNQGDGLLLICKTKTGITGWKDLAGKKVGVWLGGGESGPQAAAIKAGVAVKDVEWLPQKFSMEEFFQDAFDCASAVEWNEKHIVYREGYVPGKDIIELRQSDMGQFLPGDSIVTLESTVADKPEIVQGIVTGTMRGWQWVCSSEKNRLAGAQYTVDAAPDLDLDLQIIQVDEMCALINSGPAEKDKLLGGLYLDSWQAAADAALASGQLSVPADVTAAFRTEFMDAMPQDLRIITWSNKP